MAARRSEPLRAMEDSAWRAEAEALGWGAQDLDALASILKISINGPQVVKVLPRRILLWCTRLALSALPGEPPKYVPPQRTLWEWHRSLDLHSKCVSRSEAKERPWCPAHAYACNPDAHGCGDRMRVVQFELCECPSARGHFSDCEVWIRNREAELAKVEAEERAREAAKQAAAEPTTRVKPPEKLKIKHNPKQTSFGF